MASRISSELRTVEAEIDYYYKTNPLIKLPFAEAVWHLLACFEDSFLIAGLKSSDYSSHEMATLIENHFYLLRYALFWLWSACPSGGAIPYKYSEECYQAARDLFALAEQYCVFVSIYTYANRGMLDIELQGNVLVPSDIIREEARLDAYDRLHSIVLDVEPPDLLSIRKSLDCSVRITSDSFSYRLSPSLVAHSKRIVEHFQGFHFQLPGEWKFSRYTLGDFKHVYLALTAIALIHYNAREKAAISGCRGGGVENAVLVFPAEELHARVCRYSGCDDRVVGAILEDLTYGSAGIRSPDPALQPLILLESNEFMTAPQVWLNVAPERNLTVLLNRIPAEREIYSRLVNQKESLMRVRLIEALAHLHYRFEYGDVPSRSDLPDIDLAIVDDESRHCLLMELKWLINPAEPGEVIEKSEEIERGVRQVLMLMDALADNCPHVREKLQVDETYVVFGTVASANFIGQADTQHPDVPIVNSDHLVQRIVDSRSLPLVVSWLANREYLPIEGTHYLVKEVSGQVGRWKALWYGIQLLNPVSTVLPHS